MKDADTAQMIEDIEDQESKLTAWERQFLSSVASREAPLTEKQQTVLLRIWTKVTRN